MNKLIEMAAAREQELQRIIRMKQRALQNETCTDKDRIYASINGKSTQFYRVLPDGRRRYLKKDSTEIRRFAQNEYDRKVLKAAQHEANRVRKLREFYETHSDPESQFEKIHPLKRAEIVPIQEPDVEFVRKWLSVPYAKPDYRFEAECFYTDRGEQVRSKSELILANQLHKKGIPYRYECPLQLETPEYFAFQTVYPDFTILRVRDRQEVFWEHLGMLDDPDYLARNLRKIRLYAKNGLFPGRGLILSYETADFPLDTKRLDEMIEAYCR